jgi:hypothetical protein
MHMVKHERERGISMEVDGRALEREGRVSRPQFVDELFEFLERQAARSMERKVSNEEGGMSESKRDDDRQDDDGIRREADERRSPALEHPAHAFVLERVCDDGRDRGLAGGVHNLFGETPSLATRCSVECMNERAQVGGWSAFEAQTETRRV